MFPFDDAIMSRFYFVANWFVGFDSPRTDTEGNPLPNERLISIAIFQEPAEDQDPAITLASMVFGQIMDHDIGRTAVTQHPGRKSCPRNLTVSSALNEWSQLYVSCLMNVIIT